jgi:uncharacterized protein (DUF983 family)
MIGKGSKLNSILRFKCPPCQEGDFFVDNNPYHLRYVGDVRDTCAVCGRKFENEPGFYYGAMYVAYALGVALSVGVYLAMTIFWTSSAMWARAVAIMVMIVLMGPLIYALSKIIWANLFMTYKGVSPLQSEQAGSR